MIVTLTHYIIKIENQRPFSVASAEFPLTALFASDNLQVNTRPIFQETIRYAQQG